MRKGSIYIIRNKINDKVYIGQTVMSVQERFRAHCKPCTAKQRGTYKIYNAFNKYGVSNFYVETLKENIPISILDKTEIEYIEKFDSYFNGYNSTKGGDGRTINKLKDETAIVNRYLNGETCSEIAKDYKVHAVTIQRALNKNKIKLRQNGNKFDSVDKKTFKKLYFDEKLSNKDIAKNLSVDSKTISRWGKKCGYISRNFIRNSYVMKQKYK